MNYSNLHSPNRLARRNGFLGELLHIEMVLDED
jgi:hypothetical protein